MASQKSTVVNLYKTLLYMGRDYPLGYEYFRTRCHKVFLKNSKESDPEKIQQMINHGNYVVKELEALYMLKKYRTLKRRYYMEEHDDYSKMIKKINQEGSQH